MQVYALSFPTDMKIIYFFWLVCGWFSGFKCNTITYAVLLLPRWKTAMTKRVLRIWWHLQWLLDRGGGRARIPRGRVARGSRAASCWCCPRAAPPSPSPPPPSVALKNTDSFNKVHTWGVNQCDLPSKFKLLINLMIHVHRWYVITYCTEQTEKVK